MKKLLSLLASFSVVSSSAAVAVACGTNPYDVKDDNGDSILINSIGNITDGGKSSINASDVLWKLIDGSGSEQKSKLAQTFIQLMNASFLLNAETNFKGDDSKEQDFNNTFVNDKLVDLLISKAKQLNDDIDREIKREKDKNSEENGKKAEEKWLEKLKDKFPGFEDKEVLEQKYKQDKLLNGTNNATSYLLDILLNTDQLGVNWISKADLLKTYETYSKNEKVFKNWFDNNKAAKKTINQMENLTKDPKDWTEELKDDMSFKDFTNLGEQLNKTENEYAPVEINNLSADSASTRAGYLSKSQIFFLNKFYENRAPLAISEVTFSFASNGKFDDGITYKDFQGENDVVAIEINKFLKQIKDNGEDEWRRIMLDTSQIGYEGATAKQYSNLLTLANSSDFSQTLRSSVYNYINGNKGSAATKEESASNYEEVSKLISKINRNKTDNNMFTEVIEGLIAFVETDGLHFVHIDGYDKLGKSTKIEGNADEQKAILEELNTFRDFSKLSSKEQSLEIQSKAKSNKDYYKKLNSRISNEYLKFLVNNSLVKGKESSTTSFDIMAEVKNWAKISQPSSDGDYTWWLAVYEYFQTMTKLKEEEEFVNKFISFGDSQSRENEVEPNDIAKQIGDWFIKAISTIKSNVANNPLTLFIQAQQKAKDEIDQKTESNYPKGTFTTFTYKQIIDILEIKFKVSETTNKNFTYSSKSLLTLSSSFKGGLK